MDKNLTEQQRECALMEHINLDIESIEQAINRLEHYRQKLLTGSQALRNSGGRLSTPDRIKIIVESALAAGNAAIAGEQLVKAIEGHCGSHEKEQAT